MLIPKDGFGTCESGTLQSCSMGLLNHYYACDKFWIAYEPNPELTKFQKRNKKMSPTEWIWNTCS